MARLAEVRIHQIPVGLATAHEAALARICWSFVTMGAVIAPSALGLVTQCSKSGVGETLNATSSPQGPVTDSLVSHLKKTGS